MNPKFGYVKETLRKPCGAINFHEGQVVKMIRPDKFNPRWCDVKTVSGSIRELEVKYFVESEKAKEYYEAGKRNIND